METKNMKKLSKTLNEYFGRVNDITQMYMFDSGGVHPLSQRATVANAADEPVILGPDYPFGWGSCMAAFIVYPGQQIGCLRKQGERRGQMKRK